MSNTDKPNNDVTGTSVHSSGRRPYQPPQVLSVERLEAVASTCVANPLGAVPYGKILGSFLCQALSS